jgi:hypothetical protein
LAHITYYAAHEFFSLNIDVSEILRKFSKSPGCIRKIPLNPPLQKGEAIGMPGLIDMFLKSFNLHSAYVGHHYTPSLWSDGTLEWVLRNWEAGSLAKFSFF